MASDVTSHSEDATSAQAVRLRWLVAISLAAVVTLAAVRVFLTVTAITGTRADVSALRQLSRQNIATMSPTELDDASMTFHQLHTHLRRLDAMTALPPAEQQMVEHLPWIGERYVAARQLIQVGVTLSDAGAAGSTLGGSILAAYQTTGVNKPARPGASTWLDVLARNQPALDHIIADVAEADQQRQAIHTSLLPGSIQKNVADLDTVLNQFDANGGSAGITSDLRALTAAFGANQTARYLVLLQNPAELRPSGGFPGTMGLVTIDRGQLVSYKIFDGHTLTDAYIAQRKTKRPEPWPIDKYFPQDGFLLHDAGWYANFPTAGATIMSMYAETDWPAIDGVIAVDPAAVGDLLQVTGPLDLNIEGETRHVTADNFYDEIERQRRLIVEGLRPWDMSREVHKEAVATIGEAVIERLKTANRSQLQQAVKLLTKSADVRDAQIYSSNPSLEALVAQRGWSGSLNPDPAIPAVAVTFANVALQKTSENMHPALDFEVSPVIDGRRTVSLTINVDNTGPLNEDPLYSSRQVWWIQVALPASFQRLSSSLTPQPDPDAPNGGSYVVAVNPTEAQQMTVDFSMPANATFLLRRQPGLTTATVQVDVQGCDGSLSTNLSRDQRITPATLCQPPN